MSYEFKFYALNGMERKLLDADSVEVVDEHGNSLELYGRRSDGEITLSAKDRLVIRPVAANCARVSSEK